MKRRRRKVCPVHGETLSPNDASEIEKFKRYIGVQASRKAGGDPGVCDMLEQLIYPENERRMPRDETPEA